MSDVAPTPRPRGMLLEVCVGSLDDARAAEAAGADRIELCGALELGGLTPSAGLIEQVLGEVNLPCVVMLRPRAGGFGYSPHEFRCMQLDAQRALDLGAAGIVFGMLTPQASIDRSRVASLVQIAAERQTVFHRAFDFISDKSAALETLVELGVTRILTSGGPPTASEGADILRQLIATAAGRIEILPAGGIQSATIAPLQAETGCTQLHVGAATAQHDQSVAAEASASLCDLSRLADGAYRAVDESKLLELRQALNSLPASDSPSGG